MRQRERARERESERESERERERERVSESATARQVIQLLFEQPAALGRSDESFSLPEAFSVAMGGGTSENRKARVTTKQEMFSLGVNGV